MAESHIERKEKRKWPKAKEKKREREKNIIRPKAYQKRKKGRKHKVLKYAKGIRLKKKREM